MVTKSQGGITFEYWYNGQDQLVQVKKNGQVVDQFAYDDFGNRLVKVEADGRTTLELFREPFRQRLSSLPSPIVTKPAQ